MKLKPCPFCGGRAIEGPVGHYYGVWCESCHAEVTVSLPDKMPLGCVTLAQVEEQTLNAARAKWQRRV